MTSLDETLRQMREQTAKTLAALQAQADRLVAESQADLRQLVADHGFAWCDACDGTGAVERPDAGHMRRFGLREWDGCRKCGGGRETRGKGYLSR